MSNQYRKPLPNYQGDTQLEYFDVRQAVEDIQPGDMKLCHTLRKCWQNSLCVKLMQKI